MGQRRVAFGALSFMAGGIGWELREAEKVVLLRDASRRYDGIPRAR